MARRLRRIPARRGAVGGIVACSLVLVWSTVAFACTYIPHLYAVSPTAAAPGEDLTLVGTALATQQPVTLHWNGVHGPVLGTVTPDSQGNFRATVKVPDVAPGAYFVVADAGGTDVARAAFQVIGATSRPGSPQAPAVAPDAADGAGAVSVDAPPTTASWLSAAIIPGLVLFTVGALGLAAFGVVLALRRRVPTRVR